MAKKRTMKSAAQIAPWNPEFGWQILRRMPAYRDGVEKFIADLEAQSNSSEAIRAIMAGFSDADDKVIVEALLASVGNSGKNEARTRKEMIEGLEESYFRLLGETDRPSEFSEDLGEGFKALDLYQWLWDWGHILAFPIPPEIEYPDHALLFGLWRLRPSMLVKEDQREDREFAFSGFEGVPLAVLFPGGKGNPRLTDFDGSPVMRVPRCVFQINTTFDDDAIIAGVTHQLKSILATIRGTGAHAPRLQRLKSQRDNVDEYFKTWDLYQKRKSQRAKYTLDSLAEERAGSNHKKASPQRKQALKQEYRHHLDYVQERFDLMEEIVMWPRIRRSVDE